ncbi:unnamed protein product [Schistosoma rodhaini]|nr:unnamed protein product [Schistosoma rodhaini]
MSCNNTLPSNIFSNHHQFMQMYDSHDDNINNHNNNITHSTSNWFIPQTTQMISSVLPIPNSTFSTSLIHTMDNHSYSHSCSLQTDPFSLPFETSPLHPNTIHHYNENYNRHLHSGVQQYNSLFNPYHNYINRWNNVQMNNVNPPVEDATLNVTKTMRLHRNHHSQRRQHHRHHNNHHRHNHQQLQQQQQFQSHNIKPCDLITEDEPKPNFSYIGLIAKAILSTQERRMILSDIYQWIQLRYPYFSTRGPGWRNSIRHNLSLNDCFIKVGRAANGKGHYWGIHPANLKDFLSGDFRRRRAQRKVRRALGLSRPDDKLDDDDDDDGEFCDGVDGDGEGDGGSGNRGFDHDSLPLNYPLSYPLIPQLFQCIHPHISTYQLTSSAVTPNSSTTLTTHKHTFNPKSSNRLNTSIPLTNTNIFTLDQLTDSTNNQYTNNSSNITSPLPFNTSPVPHIYSSHLLPHQTSMNASSTSRMSYSNEFKQSTQSVNTANQLWKSSCINDTLMDLFYINLMHLLKNHHSSVQTDMNDTCTSDESLLLVPHPTAINTHTTTTSTINNNNTHTPTTTNTNTTSNTTHTTNTGIPVSIPITDHKPVDCQNVNSSGSSLDPVFPKSHPLSTQHPVNVSFNVINLIDHKLNHHSDAHHDHIDDDHDDEGDDEVLYTTCRGSEDGY